jgi:hypothetical protein
VISQIRRFHFLKFFLHYDLEWFSSKILSVHHFPHHYLVIRYFRRCVLILVFQLVQQSKESGVNFHSNSTLPVVWKEDVPEKQEASNAPRKLMTSQGWEKNSTIACPKPVLSTDPLSSLQCKSQPRINICKVETHWNYA